MFDEAYQKESGDPENQKLSFAVGKWAFIAILAICYSLFATKIIVNSDKREEEYKSTIEEQQEKIDNQIELMEMMAEECNFFDEHAVIVTTEGRKYHTYNCWHWSGHDIYIYNIENAEAMGYTPCLDCH